MLSGDEEARLAFDGAVRGTAPQPDPVLVVDIGGGSTELVLGTDAVEAAHSMDVGCVRLSERHLHSDPPSADDTVAAEIRDDRLCDRFEFLLLAGRPASVPDFLREEGIDPDR